jgi:RND family efflux transporter MFP subunit
MKEEATVDPGEKAGSSSVLRKSNGTSLKSMERGVIIASHGRVEAGAPGNNHGAHPGEPNGKQEPPSKKHRWIAPTVLLLALAITAGGLAAWKMRAMKAAGIAAASQPEPVESVTVAIATERTHRRSTVSIGTVVALRSITLRNELPGTVREATLTPGQIVEPGTVLVALDVSVEEAELKAQEAQVALAETQATRMQRGVQTRATSQMELDRARAELDVARAQTERIKAIIARKTIRAPFRARIGISDVHPGQYLVEGTLLTTLQGIDAAAHVDFTVPQQVAHSLREGETVEILSTPDQPPVSAKILALDSRVDPVTRNAAVRAKIDAADRIPGPGASVRVRVPVGEAVSAVSIPVSALRKGPGGDHVFVIGPDKEGKTRAQIKWVQPGAALGDEVLIISGLSPGDQVAAAGSFKLRESVQVAIADKKADQKTNAGSIN